MKGKYKRLFCIAAFLLVFPMLVSCTEKENNGSEKAVSLFDGKYCTVYDLEGKCGKKPEDRLLCALFGREEPPRELAALSMGVLILGKGTDGFEVDVFRVKHPSEKKKVRALLSERLDRMQGPQVKRYLSEKYEERLFSAGIYETGEYIILLSTGNNDVVFDELKKNL